MATVSGGAALKKKLAEFAKNFSGNQVKVGFLENATYANGMSVPEVAAINNFGAPGAGIPARPFFSDMIRDKSSGWAEKGRRLLRHTNYDGDKALGLFGEGIAGQLRQAIVDTVSPPNAPVTNVLKQRFPAGVYEFSDVQKARADVRAGVTAPAGKPLVWSGIMLASVDSEVGPA